MRKALIGALTIALTAGCLLATGSAATAQPPGDEDLAAPSTAPVDDLPNPLGDKQRALKQSALTSVINGDSQAVTRNGSTVVQAGEKTAELSNAEKKAVRQGKKVKPRKVPQYVELAREATDRIFVVLVDFGNQRHPSYPDQDTDPATPGPAVFDGPRVNQIPEPNRRVDNSTIWQEDYSADYFRDLYFGEGKNVESLKTYYERQSSGRYSVEGTVTDWVTVPYNEARYGRSNGFPCASNVCSNTWAVIVDGVKAWYDGQIAAGRTPAEVKAEMATFDVWDRYDHDGDGDFNEPDGYIDHFQIVHAGGDQADGDPNQGEDAIWSHRWYVNTNLIGVDGPANAPFGGTQIGNTGIWIGDYTIQPENGGLSVFAHEYAHDLGIPDLYDTTGVGQGTFEFWSLMAQSRLSAKKDQGIGTRPGDLGAWEKLQLGWLDYEVAVAGQKKTYQLGPHEYNSKDAQGLVVVLPKKPVTTALQEPFEGEHTWWSGTGNDFSHTMTRSVSLPAGTAELSFQAAYNIEDCGPDACDYAFVEVDDGSGFVPIAGSITHPDENNAIDGDSDGWVPATFDLSAYAGTDIQLRFRYTTDPAAAGQNADTIPGLFVDALSITSNGSELFADGAEAGDDGWTFDGFGIVAATTTQEYDNYYLASYRSYLSYDQYLQTGPYNFGWLNSKPDWAEHFPLQDGLLVSYWDTSQADNNVGTHPGAGLILPVDAHPAPIYRLDGTPWRVRVANYDATFGTQKADSFALHVDGKKNHIRGQSAQPVFNDKKKFFYDETPYAGVKLPAVGVTIKVLDQKANTMKIRLDTK